MVASATMQSYVAGACLVPRVSTMSRSISFSSIQSMPRQHGGSAMRVRCQIDEQSTTPVTSSPLSSSSLPQQSPIPPPKAKSPPSFADLLAFGGPAPERINGRLAMVGFVAALAVEAARGDGLVAQVANGGLPWFAATAALLSAASLVPLLKGVTPQSRSDGLMTADAEMWNGRFAMMGIAALAFTEYLTGGPLV